MISLGVVALLVLLCPAQSYGERRDQYIDATPPNLEPRVFAPGIVSISREEGSYEERPVFSPDFRECYFDVSNYKTKTVTSFSMRYENGRWTSPEPAFFAKYKGFQASIAPKGDRLFFAAPRPDDEKSRGIWLSENKRGVWTNPVLLGSPINSQPTVGFPCVTGSNTLYFLSMTGPGKGVYRSRREKNAYRSIEKLDLLPPGSESIVGDFYVSPDERYIVFYSNLPSSLGKGGLFIAFAKSDGSWTRPQNLGEAVNNKNYNFAPSISPDGKYLFFSRDVAGREGDIFWIGTGIFGGLR
jgi:hypothetical protein